jgi:hypothetical protein
MPLSRFLRQCLETVEKWSKQYANRDKVFILTPTIKKYTCMHLVGLAIRLKYVKPPPVAKDIPIGQRRKR